jgi:competence protein ComEC
MRITRALILFAAVVVLVPLGRAAERVPAAEPGKLIFVNVGQGDGVVIKLGQTVVASEVGEHKVENVDEALRSVKAKRIDVAILSHPHDDHVENLIALVEEYHWPIERVLLSDSAWWFGTGTNRRVRELFAREGGAGRVGRPGERFDWGGGEWLILNPPRGEFAGGASEAANVSIVYLLSFNGVRAMFTGDVKATVGRRIAAELKAIADISVARRPE